ncbi:MAG: hypothetical protein ACLPT6_14655 [Desulfobaccales bacterium]
MFARNAAKGIWSRRRAWMRLIPAGKGYKCQQCSAEFLSLFNRAVRSPRLWCAAGAAL